jgi:Co/Zn/Cd efflux system component
MVDRFKNKSDLEGYKHALCVVFGIHIFMFIVSFTAAILGKSSAVMADSIDFIGDAASYALSMYVLTKSKSIRATVSIAKAITMIVFSLMVIVYTIIRIREGVPPDYQIMVTSGVLGIVSHLVCVYYLYKFRNGDSNQVSVWVCTINDLISNTLTVIASYFVMLTNSIAPDIIAAFIIVSIAIYGALTILKKAIKEIREHSAEREKRIRTAQV